MIRNLFILSPWYLRTLKPEMFCFQKSYVLHFLNIQIFLLSVKANCLDVFKKGLGVVSEKEKAVRNREKLLVVNYADPYCLAYLVAPTTGANVVDFLLFTIKKLAASNSINSRLHVVFCPALIQRWLNRSGDRLIDLTLPLFAFEGTTFSLRRN